MAFEVEGGHLSVGDSFAGWVGARLEGRLDGQAGLGRGAPQVAEQRVPGGQGLAGPVRADRAEQAMLDRVPLRAARRIVADGHRQSVPVAELVLELPFPDPRAGT